MMHTMKAMALRAWSSNQPLELTDVPTPAPRPGEIRVRVAAVGVNPVDWKMCERGPLHFANRVIGPPLPFVPGIDFAGTVDLAGANVTTLNVGDRVVGGTDFSRGQRGSYAEWVTARPDQLCTIPTGVAFETAAAVPVAGVTAWISLVEIGRLPARGTKAAVLVLGAAGGVGQFAVQIGRLYGARVVGVCSTRNVDIVRGLGAETAIDYTAGDALAQARPHGPFDVIVDCVGGYSASACRALLAPGGRHVMVAGAEAPGSVLQLLAHPLSTRTVLGRSTTARLRPLLDAIGEGRIRVNIARILPLAEAVEAHALSRGGRTVGKIVLVT